MRVVLNSTHPTRVLKYLPFLTGGISGDKGAPTGPDPPPTGGYISEAGGACIGGGWRKWAAPHGSFSTWCSQPRVCQQPANRPRFQHRAPLPLAAPRAAGRPVDVEQLADGSLLVSDDGEGAVYRISYTPPA